MRQDPKHKAYVDRVLEGTDRYAQDLLRENEKLRALTAALEQENRRLDERVQNFESDLARRDSERLRLIDELRDVESENRRYTDQYVTIAQQNANLANLYVASYMLHASLDRQEILAAIEQIIVNLVGSEELGIYEVMFEEQGLRLIASMGIDEARYGALPLDRGVIARTLHSGAVWLSTDESESPIESYESTLTACIPLAVDGEAVGAIAIFRLLQQKPSLGDSDRELFDLLATHAAMALHCSAMTESLRRNRPPAVSTIEPAEGRP